MIIDSELAVGIQINTAAALGISLASQIKGLTGKKLWDRDGKSYEGVTNIPIPILALNKDEIKQKYDDLLERQNDELKVIAFSDVAQKSLSYDDYEEKLALIPHDEVSILGICIYGPKKMVNKITGNLKMLR
jgi:hypothetical protein